MGNLEPELLQPCSDDETPASSLAIADNLFCLVLIQSVGFFDEVIDRDMSEPSME